MNEMENKAVVFISYAWGGALDKKEWIRRSIVKSLDWKFTVFWDRDSIGFGETIDSCILKALSQRPISVFCLCDADYLSSAKIVGSGLYRELKLLAEMASADDVKIIPLILEAGCAANLPEPLAGRAYLNLEALHQRGLDFGATVLALAGGATQAQVIEYLTQQINKANLHQRANAHFKDRPLTLWGNARTHEVTVRPGQLLLPPKWMWGSMEWGYMLSDEDPTFCPSKGRWHWDYSTPSRGMRALGTAVMSAFFPQYTSSSDQHALQTGGAVLAQRVFAMTYITEPFVLESEELVQVLINDLEGYAALEHLLNSVCPWNDTNHSGGGRLATVSTESADCCLS